MRRRAKQSDPAHQYPDYGLDLSFYAPSWRTPQAVARMKAHIDNLAPFTPVKQEPFLFKPTRSEKRRMKRGIEVPRSPEVEAYRQKVKAGKI